MASPYYQDNDTTLYCGDARDMSELADGSIQCVVTSPPYWGLRKYSGVPDLIWGGDPDCDHQWGSDILGDTRADAFKDWGNKGSGIDAKHIPVSQGAFCQCGAWRGSYGLEPTPELYVEHTVEVYAGRRVNGKTRYIREHIKIWEAANGKLPKAHLIHHVNGIKHDNRLGNLKAIPRRKHSVWTLVGLAQERVRELESEAAIR